MLADPQTITLNAVANNLNRVGNSETSAVYRNSDGTLELRTFRTTLKNRATRHGCSVTQNLVVADPLADGVNLNRSSTITFSMVVPEVGFDAATRLLLIDAVLDWLRASTDAVPVALTNGQI